MKTIAKYLMILFLMMPLGCKSLLGDDASLLEQQMQLYGTIYYQREVFCMYTDDCADEDEEEAVLDQYNDDDAIVGDDEEYVDRDGDGALEMIAVYVDEDDIPDMLVIDSDGDGRYDRILRAENDAVKNGKANGGKKDDEILEDDRDGKAEKNSVTEGPIEYGDKVWCGVNKIKDSNGDGIVNSYETSRMHDDLVKGDKCNDPDWFCSEARFDARCFNEGVTECMVYNCDGGEAGVNDPEDEEGEDEEDESPIDPVLCKISPILCKNGFGK